MPTLKLDNLVKIYHGRTVVDRVSIALENGSVAGLLGPNGAGKTTTFYITVGMVRPDGGHVYIDDDEITGDPMFMRARKGVGYLPQEASIFRKLTVRENILAVLEMHRLDKTERETRTDRLLEELGIARLAKQRASVLSGGERRRLEISRALATGPSFILLDEPFAGIDPLAVIDIKKIIAHLKDRGIGIIISDHNVRETLEVCDEAYILSDGKVIESGSPKTIADSQVARRIYLGENFRL
jgi:lipopolysaccharide export system ATP-binding protein